MGSASELSKLDPDIGLVLYTDGSASHLDRSGGWAWLVLDRHGRTSANSGWARDTTISRMEMQAWIEGLDAIYAEHGPQLVLVYSDSEHVGLGVRDPSRTRRANADMWQMMDTSVYRHEHVEFVHVRGHTGNEYNERVDKLAGQARKRGLK